MQESEVGQYLFQQFAAALDHLQQKKDPVVVTAAMELKVMSLAGYSPQLANCVSCGLDQGEMVFSYVQGGLLCSNCKMHDMSHVLISPSTRRILHILAHVNLEQLGNTQLSTITRTQIVHCVHSFIDTHIEVKLNSRAMLEHFLSMPE